MQRERGEGEREWDDREVQRFGQRESVRASLTAVVAIYSQTLFHSPKILFHLPHTDRQISLHTHTLTKLFDMQKYSKHKKVGWLLHTARPVHQNKKTSVNEWEAKLRDICLAIKVSFLLHQELCNNSSCLPVRVLATERGTECMIGWGESRGSICPLND